MAEQLHVVAARAGQGCQVRMAHIAANDKNLHGNRLRFSVCTDARRGEASRIGPRKRRARGSGTLGPGARRPCRGAPPPALPGPRPRRGCRRFSMFTYFFPYFFLLWLQPRGKTGTIPDMKMGDSALEALTARALSQHNLVRPGERVLAAVSGGADSVALLLVLDALKASMGFSLVCAHYDHGIRGEASREDARFVRGLCRSLGVECIEGRGDVPSLARAWRASLEDAARRARYAFLEEAAARCGADKIALAHQREDQAETLLLHLAHGCGPEGLAAMRRCRATGFVRFWAFPAPRWKPMCRRGGFPGARMRPTPTFTMRAISCATRYSPSFAGSILAWRRPWPTPRRCARRPWTSRRSPRSGRSRAGSGACRTARSGACPTETSPPRRRAPSRGGRAFRR